MGKTRLAGLEMVPQRCQPQITLQRGPGRWTGIHQIGGYEISDSRLSKIGFFE